MADTDESIAHELHAEILAALMVPAIPDAAIEAMSQHVEALKRVLPRIAGKHAESVVVQTIEELSHGVATWRIHRALMNKYKQN